MGNFRQELIRKVQFRVSLNQQFVEQPGSKPRIDSPAVREQA